LTLFRILKLFGLDVPAKIEAVTASLELRVEQATDHVKQVAQEAAGIAALSAIAIATAAMAVGVGLIAVYRWTADAYGAYAGLGAVGAILVVVTVIFATAAMIKGKSLAANRTILPRYAAQTAGVTSDSGAGMSASAADARATEPHSGNYSWATQAGVTTSAAPTASASDPVEPLAFFLSKFMKYPRIGNPAVDELIGNLRVTAHGTADEAIACAANVIRHGNRTNLVVVLTGAAVVGWLLAHHSEK
jgi:hypothetical protein